MAACYMWLDGFVVVSSLPWKALNRPLRTIGRLEVAGSSVQRTTHATQLAFMVRVGYQPVFSLPGLPGGPSGRGMERPGWGQLPVYPARPGRLLPGRVGTRPA